MAFYFNNNKLYIHVRLFIKTFFNFDFSLVCQCSLSAILFSQTELTLDIFSFNRKVRGRHFGTIWLNNVQTKSLVRTSLSDTNPSYIKSHIYCIWSYSLDDVAFLSSYLAICKKSTIVNWTAPFTEGHFPVDIYLRSRKAY